jgi:hypothetical protein
MLQRLSDSVFFRGSMPLSVKVLNGLLGCALIVFVSAIAQAREVSVLTYHNDRHRTGWNSSETILTPANVTPSTFGLIRSVPLDARVDEQPLVVAGLTIGGSQHTVVYVATENNTLYAIDGSSGNVLLQANFGTNVTRPCGILTFVNGILSTPVIDLTHKRLFMIASVELGSQPTFQLHALDLSTLQDMPGSPVNITPTHTLENGSVYNLDIVASLQRPALLEANGNVYAAFGGCGNSQGKVARGWLLGWNATTLAPLSANLLTNTLVLTTPPLFYLTTIWMSGYGVAADNAGNLFFFHGRFQSWL